MATTPTRQSYCLCSEATLGEIIDRQLEEPLPFSRFVERHTRCNEGCRSCVKKLRRMLIDAGAFIDDDREPGRRVLPEHHSREAAQVASTIKE